MTIRNAQPDDLDFYVDCVKSEGWLSETRFVFEGFLAHDREGCFVAETDRQRVGMCVATSYGTDGFLGELIVAPSQRGRGLGTSLMKRAIAYLQSRGCRSIYLDGDLPAVPIYERLGFRAATRSLRFLGRIEGRRSENILPITPHALPALLAFDRDAFGADRSFFLRRRIAAHSELCLMQMTGAAPVGFIMGQPGHGVVTVGPWLAADGVADPLVLLRALAKEIGDQKLRIGLLESNKKAAAMMRSLTAFTETEPCIRMVLGPDSGLGTSRRLFAAGAPSKG
jgi:ribosomal protein S18 acetylase RimI-like enzyme